MKFNLILHSIKYFVLTYKFALLSALLILVSVFFVSKVTNLLVKENINEKALREIADCDRSLYATAPIKPTRVLNDKNDIQNIHAQVNGLKQIYISNASFEADSAMLVKDLVLVHLKNNPLYHLKELTHSYPFTTPEMADLLNTIGFIFRQKMKDKNHDYYRILITSALRTNETQQNLTSRNRNASTQSAHLFGATIDVTYKDFYNVKTDSIEQNWIASDALRETMIELREQCRLLVVRERHQACYHFTVVNCDPAKAPAGKIERKTFVY
ncbi:MAG: DUF5715 family protein [Paludibacteraceae bacterium]